MSKILLVLGAFVASFLFIVGMSPLLALPVMWLWNYVAVDTFRMPILDFWHSWALTVLCGALFKSGAKSK